MRTPSIYLFSLLLAAGTVGCGDDVKKPPVTDPDQTIIKKDMTHNPDPDGGAVKDINIEDPDQGVPDDAMTPDTTKTDTTKTDTINPDMMLTECASEPNGTPCGDQTSTPCNAPDTCQGGVCVQNVLAPGAACGDQTNTACTDPNTCSASGVCQPNHAVDGLACGDTIDNACNGADTCLAGVCGDNFEVSGTACGSTTDNACTDPDVCDGFGNCLMHDAPANTLCGNPADTECTDPDTCDGQGVCETHDLAAGAACGDQSTSECDGADTCDESGVCQPNNIGTGGPCGDQTETACNHADTCDENGVCQPNQVAVGGTCGDQTNTQCTSPDTCDANGECQPNHAMLHSICGSQAVTDCTDPDECDGMGACRPNDAPSGTPCGDSTVAECNGADTCDGLGGCATNIAAVGDPCGDTADTDCDNPDTCDANQQCLANNVNEGLTCYDCTSGPGECDQCNEGTCSNLAACGGGGPGSLALPFNTNNSHAGNMFDVEILQDVVIQSFDINVSSSGPQVDVVVYYREGSCLNNYSSSSGWNLLASTTVTAAGMNVPTSLNLNLGLSLTAGQTVAFYIAAANYSSGGITWHYTNGTSFGAVLGQDSTLRVFTGYGTPNPLFPSYVNSPRNWNGNIYYSSSMAFPMTLETTYNGAVQTQGSMFDVTAKHEVNVTGLQANLPVGDHDVVVYYREGTHVGFEGDALAWIPLADTTVTSTASGAGTAIVFPGKVRIPSGETYAFYVTTKGNTAMLTLDGTSVGTLITDDFNIEIYEGTGVTYSFGATSAPQIFNGAVDYDACEMMPR